MSEDDTMTLDLKAIERLRRRWLDTPYPSRARDMVVVDAFDAIDALLAARADLVAALEEAQKAVAYLLDSSKPLPRTDVEAIIRAALIRAGGRR